MQSSQALPNPALMTRDKIFTIMKENKLDELRSWLKTKENAEIIFEPFQETLFHIAAEVGNVEAAKILKEVGCKYLPNCLEFGPVRIRFYPLHWASQFNQPSMIAFFVSEMKIDVNSISDDKYKETSLHVAATCGSLQAAHKLFELHALHMGNYEGHFPIHEAAMSNQPLLIKFFTNEMKIDVNECKTETFNNTSLHLAAKYNCLDAAEMLKTLGAKNEVNKNGITPLHFAAGRNKPVFVRFLINEMQADINGDKRAISPLLRAVERNFLPATQALVELGATITKECFSEVRNVDILIYLFSKCKDPETLSKIDFNTLKQFFEKPYSINDRRKLITCVLACQKDKDPEMVLDNFFAPIREENHSSIMSIDRTLIYSAKNLRNLLSFKLGLNLELILELAKAQQALLSETRDYNEITNIHLACKDLKPVFMMSKNYGLPKLPTVINNHIFKFLTIPDLKTTPFSLFKATIEPPKIIMQEEKSVAQITSQTRFFQRLVADKKGHNKNVATNPENVVIKKGAKHFKIDLKYIEEHSMRDTDGNYALDCKEKKSLIL